jgi:RimJ/RimL family protein N-acetyltransferase
MTLRALTLGDEAALEGFLAAHRDSSMFLRSNLRASGLVYRGQRLQADYVAAFSEGAIVGVAAHTWSGMLMMQAPERARELALACVAASGRKVTGLIGPLAHVQAARAALGLVDVAGRKDDDEGLFALELAELRVPARLASGGIEARAALPQDRELLCGWRVAYDCEILGCEASAAVRQGAEGFIDWQMAEGFAWLALEHGVPVSFSGFNSCLPEIVQLGGIFTPLALRGRGHAKAAIAAQLLASRASGVRRAVLFASNPNAIRCYEGLGFRRVSDFGLVLW